MNLLVTHSKNHLEETEKQIKDYLNSVTQATHYILGSLSRTSISDWDRGCPVLKLIEAGNTETQGYSGNI